MSNEAKSTLKLFDDITVLCVELTNSIIQAAINQGISAIDVEETEKAISNLRTLANCAWATEVLSSRTLPDDVQVRVSVGDNYLEFEFPYEMVAKTTIYNLSARKLVATAMLVNTSRAWHFLMTHLIKAARDYLPFEAPLAKAKVTTTILYPTRQQRDPDHFWFRPVLDSFVGAGLVTDDSSERVKLEFDYGVDATNPSLIVQLYPSEIEPPLVVRAKSLRTLFSGNNLETGT